MTILARILYFMLGGVLCGMLVGARYSARFDPDRYWLASMELAAQSAQLACVRSGTDHNTCYGLAIDIYRELSEIK